MEYDMTDTADISPLAEAEVGSLDELFARLDGHIQARTLNLPNAQRDLASVVTELRRQREAWAKAEASGATRAPKPKKAPQAATTIDDLGLDEL
jgi:hypothetical protein